MKEQFIRPAMTLALALSVAIATAGLARGAKTTGANDKNDPGCAACQSQAAAMFGAGKVDETLKLLEEWQPRCPSSAKFHLLFSTVLLSKGDVEKAETHASKAVELAPDSLPANLQKAMALAAMDKTLQASESFERVVALDPECREAWIALASIYRKLHEDDKATAATAKAAELEPNFKARRAGTLNSLKQAGKFTEATAEIKRLLSDPATTPQFAEQLGRDALLVGAYNEAISACDKALNGDRRTATPFIIGALARYCQSDYEACLERSTHALEREPGNLDGLCLQAIALSKLNRPQEAELSLKNLKDAPESSLLWLTKGTIALSLEHLSEAEDAFKNALTYDQDNNSLQGIPHAMAHLSLATVYDKLAKPSLASEQMHILAQDKRFARATATSRN